MEPDPERIESWSRYWESGALHSCLGSYAGNYGGAIAAFWHDRFTGLTPGMHVLDLAAGNGPIGALMLGAVGPGNMPELDAVDLATVAPQWMDSQPQDLRRRVRFHTGVGIESLPFGDASFERIYSQFGFEYAERAAALKELARVAAPEAEIALVCHHDGSYLVDVAKEETGYLAWLMDDPRLFDAVTGLIPHFVRSGDPGELKALKADPVANAARQVFNEVLMEVGRRADSARVPDALGQAMETARLILGKSAAEGEAAGRTALGIWRESMRAAALRSKEMIEHALDAAAADTIVAGLRDAGFAVDHGELVDRGYLLGRTIVARRTS